MAKVVHPLFVRHHLTYGVFGQVPSEDRLSETISHLVDTFVDSMENDPEWTPDWFVGSGRFRVYYDELQESGLLVLFELNDIPDPRHESRPPDYHPV